MGSLLHVWSRIAWIGVIVAGFGCREREPVPAYSENLGTAERPLMPTPLTQHDSALGKAGKKVELPKRLEPGEKPPVEEGPAAEPATPAEPGDADSNGAPPAGENSDTSGAPAAEAADTSGVSPKADADSSGEPTADNADTSGEAP